MGTAGALIGGSVIGGAASLFGSSKAAKASKSAAKTQAAASTAAANTQAQSQREQLDYLKEINRLPQQVRERALVNLNRRIGQEGPGLPGQVPLPSAELASQESLISQAESSPIYAAIMGGRGAGEESILRNAAATGGLRSGNVQENLYDYNVGLQNTALSEAYNQAAAREQTGYGREQTQYGQEYNRGQVQYGQQVSEDQRRLQELQGLAGIDTGTSQISNVMGNIGQTQAQGILGAGKAKAQGQVASGKAWQQGLQNVTNIGLGALGTGIKAGLI